MANVHQKPSAECKVGIKRKDQRLIEELRPINFSYGAFGYAAASVLFEQGDTKVLAAVSLQTQVPSFLKGKHKGWLTAEYAVLPCATRQRSPRDNGQQSKNGRSVEISRLIGRSLRSVVDVSHIGERTIQVDCDVLQADGGTRTACITAASLALMSANHHWLGAGIINRPILCNSLVAVSVGVLDSVIYSDLTQEEDNRADADFNFVITRDGALVEVQGTAETQPLDRAVFEELQKRAFDNAQQIFMVLDQRHEVSKIPERQNQAYGSFSIGSRLPR